MNRAERRRAAREAHRAARPPDALGSVLSHQLADGWKGRPCPLCGEPADWSALGFTIGMFIVGDDDESVLYPVCCVDETNPPSEDDPRVAAAEDLILAAYRLDRDDSRDFAVSPPVPAHWWYGEPRGGDKAAEDVARAGDWLWARTHPGARCWMRPPIPGEFAHTGATVSPDALVIVWAVELNERHRVFVPDGVSGISPPRWQTP